MGGPGSRTHVPLMRGSSTHRHMPCCTCGITTAWASGHVVEEFLIWPTPSGHVVEELLLLLLLPTASEAEPVSSDDGRE